MLRFSDAFAPSAVRVTSRAALAVSALVFVGSSAMAAAGSAHDSVLTILIRWAPLLLSGFLFNSHPCAHWRGWAII